MILGLFVIFDYMILCVVECTRDVAEDVRRIVFLAFMFKVFVELVFIVYCVLVLC